VEGDGEKSGVDGEREGEEHGFVCREGDRSELFTL